MANLSEAYLRKQQEWKEEGRDEGRDEKAFEIARTLLRRNMNLDFIAEVTGVPIATLHKLQQTPTD